jgi:signal transduction histidine kinase
MVALALYRIRIVETLEQRVTERTVELEQANERLQELDRLKSKFVSDVSHELRSPVSNLNMRLYLLEHDNPEKANHHIAVLKEQIGRLNSLIENILDLSRLDMGSAQATFAPVDLNVFVEQIASTYAPRIEANNLALVLDLAPDLPLVYGVASQLSQVITNLLVNAINYTPVGEIRIYTYLAIERSQVCIIIQDTGIGIHPNDLPHLFDRFYRGENARQTNIPGTGLGLGIVKEIVEQHNGVIDVQSEIGVGTIFRVCLPRYRPLR